MSLGNPMLDFSSLTPAQRILLVEDLWDSLARDPSQVPVTDEQRAELDCRLAACEADPTAGSTWDEVKQRLRSRS